VLTIASSLGFKEPFVIPLVRGWNFYTMDTLKTRGQVLIERLPLSRSSH